MKVQNEKTKASPFFPRLICGIALSAALITAGLAAYCFVNVSAFFAGAKPHEATITNLHVQPGEDNRHTDRFRFDAQLNQPVDGKQTVTMTGLYRVATADEGRAITVYYNPHHQIHWAISSPWNYLGTGVYGAISLILLFAGVVLHLVFRCWRTSSMQPTAAY